jgi:cell division septation protein DedD
MTKKQQHRRNIFSINFNAEENDFILADLNVMSDKEDPYPVPLNNFSDDEEIIDRLFINPDFESHDSLKGNDRNSAALEVDALDLNDNFSDPESYSRANFDEIPNEEDAIDRLLVDTGFDANQLTDKNKQPNAQAIDDVNLADDFSSFNPFVIEPFEQTEQTRLTEANKHSISEDVDELPAKNTHTNEAGNKQVMADINSANEPDMDFKKQNTSLADKGIFNDKERILFAGKSFNNRSLDKEDISETVSQKQLDNETIYQPEAINNLNNNTEETPFTRFKTEQNTIKKSLNDNPHNVKKAGIITYTSLSLAIAALLASVVMAIIIANIQTKVSKLTEIISIIEEDMGTSAEKNSDMGLNNSDLSIEQLNQKINGVAEHFTEINNLQTRTSELEKKVTLQKKHVTRQSQASLKPSKHNTMATATINKSIDKKKTRTSYLAKKKLSATSVKLTSAEKKTNYVKPVSGWSINLTAYKKQSDAKSKAAQLIQKGIPVKVIAVNVNNTKWYQVNMGGFKNKASADSYAAKIKKPYHLKSTTSIIK